MPIRKANPSTDKKLNDAIDAVFAEMANLPADAPEYAKCTEQLDKLIKIRDQSRSKNPMKLDMLIPVAGNLAGILVILAFEAHGHTITSKSLSFVAKPKI